MSAAAFAGQMEVSQGLSIDSRFVEFAQHQFGSDLSSPSSEDSVRTRHMRLIANSLSLFRKQSEHTKFSHFLGYSVGQFGALSAMGMIDELLAIELVALRAQCLENAWKKHPSKMLTVIGVPDHEVEKVVAQFPNSAFVSARNSKMNSSVGVDSQVSHEIEKILNSLKPMKVIEQPSCGAWHTPFMNSAAEEFRPILSEKLKLKQGQGFFIEHTAGKVVAADEISREWLIENLLTSIRSPVECRAMFESLKSEKVMTVTEFGLSPFLIKIVPFIARDFRMTFSA